MFVSFMCLNPSCDCGHYLEAVPVGYVDEEGEDE